MTARVCTIALMLPLLTSGCRTICALPDLSRLPMHDQYRFDVSYVPDAGLGHDHSRYNGWGGDLGPFVAVTGKSLLIILERTSTYTDRDEDNEPIPGTHRDRMIERAWITIPADAARGKPIRIEELDIEFLTGYEVNFLDSKGFHFAPSPMKGFITVVAEQSETMTVIFDLEVRPAPWIGSQNWKLEGERTVPRRAMKDVPVRTSRDVELKEAR